MKRYLDSCKWCCGTGRQYVEVGSSLCYCCTDCDGTGVTPPPDEEDETAEVLEEVMP